MEMQSIADMLRRAERLYGPKKAAADGDGHYTYAEIADRCRRLAAGLSSLGVERGDRVAILMANGHRYLEAYFAIPGSGAVLVPLNSRHAVPEHLYILDDAGAKVLIVDAAHAAIGEQLKPPGLTVLVAPDEYETLLRRSEPTPLAGPAAEDDLAGLFYTGGTTGKAKGVMLSHRNVVFNALSVALSTDYSEHDVYLHAAPMFHLADGGSTYAVTWVGGKHVFVPGFEPGAVLEAIASQRVTVSLFVPVMLVALVNDPRTQATDLSSLRQISHGGAPIAGALLKRCIEVFGCSFAQGYGMTEAAPALTVLQREEELVDDDRLRSAGREVVGVEITVRRPDGSLCAPREVGEVVARGPNFMLGYWRKPEETAQVLRDGWYWTGDAGYLDDGHYLYIVDRLKDMVVSGGENVYSAEVEDAIFSHPAILECAVIGVPDAKWGERVHAVIVFKPGQTATEEELTEHCRKLIAGYKLPRSFEIAEALPKSGAGKILKRDLREKHWSELVRRVN